MSASNGMPSSDTGGVIKILQINGQRRRKYPDHIKWARENGIDILLIVECPHILEELRPQGVKYFSSGCKETIVGAMVIRDGMNVRFPYIGDNHLVLKLVNPKFICHLWYVPPIVRRTDVVKAVESDLFEHLMTRKTRTLHVGDWNSRSTKLMGDGHTTHRGKQVEEAIGDHWVICNHKGTKTFRNSRGQESIPDWCVASPDIAGNVRWSVAPDVNGSDHQMILIEVSSVRVTEVAPRKIVKPARFLKQIKKQMAERPVEEWYEAFEKARLDSLAEVKLSDKEVLPDELNKLRDEIFKLAKVIASSQNRLDHLREKLEQLVKVYKGCRIEWAHKQRVEKLCAADNASVFKHVAKDACRKADHVTKDGCRLEGKQAGDEILRVIFPHQSRGQLREPDYQIQDEHQITVEEIRSALHGFNEKSAPGADGVNFRLIKQWFEANPDYFCRMLNLWWNRKVFPDELKECLIVPLAKDMEGDVLADRIRPIALMSCLSKVYEKIIATRLTHYLEANRKMPPGQFGYRQGKSAEQLLQALGDERKGETARTEVILQLDTKSAFNNAKHEAIIEEMIDKRVPANLVQIVASYLTDRRVTINLGGESATKDMLCGVNQGSSLGPLLYLIATNVAMEKVNEWMSKSKATKSVCYSYADDTVMRVASPCDLATTLTVVNRFLERYRKYLNKAGLELSPDKTKIMIGEQVYTERKVTILGRELTTQPHIKLLGVTLSHDGSYLEHCNQVDARIRKWLDKNGAIMSRPSALKHEQRKTLYRQIIVPKVTWAANLWWPGVEKQNGEDKNAMDIRRKTKWLNKELAGRICCATKRAGNTAVSTLAGVKPLFTELELARETKRARISGEYKGMMVEKNVTGAEDVHPSLKKSKVVHGTITEQFRVDLIEADVKYFTDGSKRDADVNGRITEVTGAAFIKYASGCEGLVRRFKLAEQNTAAQAELVAIREALKDAVHLENGKRVVIFSDSLSSIAAISGTQNRAELVTECRALVKNFEDQGGSVDLWHVKAHVGIMQNELADEEAARAAIEGEEIGINVPISRVAFEVRREEAKRRVKEFDNDKWGRTVKQFFDSPFDPHKKRVEINRHTTDVYTGAGENRESMIFGFKGSGEKCPCGQVQTMMHVITDCPVFMPGNSEVAKTLGIGVDLLTGPWNDFRKHRSFYKYVEHRAKSLCKELAEGNKKFVDQLCLIARLCKAFPKPASTQARRNAEAREPGSGQTLAECLARDYDVQWNERTNVTENFIYSDVNVEEFAPGTEPGEQGSS